MFRLSHERRERIVVFLHLEVSMRCSGQLHQSVNFPVARSSEQVKRAIIATFALEILVRKT